MSDSSLRAAHAHRRGVAYWLLSCLVLEAPRRDWLEQWRATLATQRDAIGGALLERLRLVVDTALGDLASASRAHRSRFGAAARRPLVFVGDGELANDAAIEAAALSGEAWRDASVAATDPLGGQLRLMALLCHDEMRAWHAGDHDAALATRRLQHRLLHERLARWVPAYCDALAARTCSRYVAEIARLAAERVGRDAARFGTAP